MGFNSNHRVKTLFYCVHQDEDTERLDTFLYGVTRDNTIIFWGSSGGASAKELIKWTINNREKI